MVGVVCCIALVLSQHPSARLNRDAFVQALRRVHQDWTRAQVKRLLGPPDDIQSNTKTKALIGVAAEVWRYGTAGPGTLATLGEVAFYPDFTVAIGLTYDLSPSVGELRSTKLLQSLYRLGPHGGRNGRLPGQDGPTLIRAANMLIRAGRTESIAALSEYGRVESFIDQPTQWLFWLVRVAFESNRPRGVFPLPAIGVTFPPPPSDLRK